MNKKVIFFVLAAMFLFILGACGNNNTDMDEAYGGFGNDEQGQMYYDEISPFTNISSESTTLNSEEFPHTKAVQVQEAKYEFRVDVNQQHDKAKYDVNVQQGQPKEGPTQQTEQAPAKPKGGDQEQQQEAAQQPAQEAQPAPEAEQEATPEQQEEQQAEPTGEGINDFEQQVIALTNEQRRNNGLSELEGDAELSQVARKKSTDMQENNYFSHTSPTYGSPFDMIRDHGISYNGAAENIAQGQPTPEQVVDAWMNSEGHRANILNGDFTHIGVGYDENGHHWTQMFITR
ncbi:putative YkwD family protein [Evansella vedderi]|uniref:YkwD family protein n=1 Tax=Evansella vedderi TaxID=38282 RepID=A0ABT9ZTS1_9BACI|nr:CAP domain-containing protein [Evansella vedderi]MDQ0254646.1 putative YkwD family protein [Evansella vedderi]